MLNIDARNPRAVTCLTCARDDYKQLGQNSVTDDIADDIAEAQDDPTNGDNLSDDQGGSGAG